MGKVLKIFRIASDIALRLVVGGVLKVKPVEAAIITEASKVIRDAEEKAK